MIPEDCGSFAQTGKIFSSIDIPQWTRDGVNARKAKPSRSKIAVFLWAAMFKPFTPSEAYGGNKTRKMTSLIGFFVSYGAVSVERREQAG
jgi:hypothetical protein